MGELIKSSLYGFLGSFLFFIIKKSYIKYKNISYDREKTTIKEYIAFLLYPKKRKRITSFYIGKTLKWFFINIIAIIFGIFIALLISNYIEYSSDLTTFDLFNIDQLFTLPVFSAQFLIGLASFIFGISVTILNEYINKLNNLLYLDYEFLEKELTKFKKKFNDNLDDEINELISNITAKIEKNRGDSFVDKISLNNWLSKAIKDYEENHFNY